MAKMAKFYTSSVVMCGYCKHCATARTVPALFVGLVDLLGAHITNEVEDTCGYCSRLKMVVRLLDDTAHECPHFENRDLLNETYGGEV